MREAIGSVQLYNIIIIFFFLIMAIMIATVTYQRSFRVNIIIVNSIEKFEGYNHLARAEIVEGLDTIGYSKLSGSSNCPSSWGNGNNTLVSPPTMRDDYQHNYCVYESPLETVYTGLLDDFLLLGTGSGGSSNLLSYRQYTVVTFVAFDVPMTGLGGIPIVARTNKIYCFEGNCN